MIRSTRGRTVSGAERRWLKVFRTLNEFQARLFAADKALDLGRGGMSRLAALTGLSRTTITKAVEELESGAKLVNPGEGRVRRVGGGRKKVESVDPGGQTCGGGPGIARRTVDVPSAPASQRADAQGRLACVDAALIRLATRVTGYLLARGG